MTMRKCHYSAPGRRIAKLRQSKGLTRADLAELIHVDVTSIAGWEAGKRLPRERQGARLAHVLGIDPEELFALKRDDRSEPIAVTAVDMVTEIPSLLPELLQRTRMHLRGFRLSEPNATPIQAQLEWRNLLHDRIKAGTLVVELVEIFYSLQRLKETLSNIIRYEGCRYRVRSYCGGIHEPAPAFSGYVFDEKELVVGANWCELQPHRSLALRITGTPFQRLFQEYWEDVWHRGTLLNRDDARDLSAVRTEALKLGLPLRNWRRFEAEAREMALPDGAPPLP